MGNLSDKNILVLSPQSWGAMFLSKHHYALELAKRGNKVFFLNPPDQANARFKSSSCLRSSEYPNLSIIDHSLGFPYALKFKAKWLFDVLMKRHIEKILKSLQLRPDIIWSFDIGNLYLLKHFPADSYKIFHPVDEPNTSEAVKAASGSNIIFSVTKEILKKYHAYKVPRHFIHHGISENFLNVTSQNAALREKIRVGFSGNLLRPDIDREVFLTIVRNNPELSFECFGSYEVRQSNIGGGATKAQMSFIDHLKSLQNVTLHGVIAPGNLPRVYTNIDVWLICYDVLKDQSKGTNYHKVMEFLSTGKVIVSNNITTYAVDPKLVAMVSSRENNSDLPKLFSKVINDLQYYNSEELQHYRQLFAAANSYPKQLEKISSLIYEG